MSRKQRKLIASLIVLREINNLIHEEKKEKKRKVVRKCWIKPLLQTRMEHDLEADFLKDLVWADDDSDPSNFTLHKFEELLKLVYNRLKKSDTVMRKAITPRLKLSVTLKYIATGASYKSLESLAKVSRNTIGVFVPEVLEAIYECLQMDYLKTPKTECEWQEIADDFQKLWQFPHTLGALAGKHIRIKAATQTGSQFYNCKGYFSLVLFASVDAHSRFTYIDVGSNGKSSDDTVFTDSYLYEALQNGALNIPQPSKLIASEGNKIPYFFVGDESFTLDRHIMKPYCTSMDLSVQQEVFNYRLDCAKTVVDCAFSRLANRFRIFQRPIEVKAETVDIIVKACCVLHNYLTKPRTPATVRESPENVVAEAFSSIGSQSQKASYKYAFRNRDELSRHLSANDNDDYK